MKSDYKETFYTIQQAREILDKQFDQDAIEFANEVKKLSVKEEMYV